MGIRKRSSLGFLNFINSKVDGRKSWGKFVGSAILTFVMGGTHVARATSILYSATDGNGRGGWAHIDISGTTLTVDLKNTGTGSSAVDPTFVLSGVFFDVVGNPVFSSGFGSGATAIANKIISLDPTHSPVPTGANAQDVAGEWAFKSGLTGAAPASYGISSAGFGLFGAGDLINTHSQNISGPQSPDGIQLGLLPTGFVSGNGGLTSTNGIYFIQNEVIFTFKVSPTFNPFTSIKNFHFQYGTATAETDLIGAPNLGGGPPSPAPLPSAAIALTSLLGLLLVGRSTPIGKRLMA
jgi:hypothetical protein